MSHFHLALQLRPGMDGSQEWPALERGAWPARGKVRGQGLADSRAHCHGSRVSMFNVVSHSPNDWEQSENCFSIVLFFKKIVQLFEQYQTLILNYFKISNFCHFLNQHTMEKIYQRKILFKIQQLNSIQSIS